MSKFEDVKRHVVEHKSVYIALGVGVVIGIAISPKAIQVIYKSPGSTQILVRRGHPGTIVRCLETGEEFASQNRAADVFGVSRQNMSRHLNGKCGSLKGFNFQKLGEAQPS